MTRTSRSAVASEIDALSGSAHANGTCPQNNKPNSRTEAIRDVTAVSLGPMAARAAPIFRHAKLLRLPPTVLPVLPQQTLGSPSDRPRSAPRLGPGSAAFLAPVWRDRTC